jgi:hypothetical protein
MAEQEENLGNVMANLGSLGDDGDDYGDEYGDEEVLPVKASKPFLFGSGDVKY